MTDLKNIGITLLVFFLLLPMFILFYSGFMTANGVTPVNTAQYNGTEYIKLITETAVNKTGATEQPSGTGLDFFFGLPALLLQTGGEIVSLLYQGPVFISATFSSLDKSFPGYHIGDFGLIVTSILIGTIMFLIVYFLRGYRA